MPVQTEYYTDPDKVDFLACRKMPARQRAFRTLSKATYDHAVVATEINVKNFNEINTLVGSALEQVWSGKKTAEEAMTEVKSQTDSLVEEPIQENVLQSIQVKGCFWQPFLIEIAIMPERNKYADENKVYKLTNHEKEKIVGEFYSVFPVFWDF